jgi:GNAT superfamily N-acetyltransferase
MTPFSAQACRSIGSTDGGAGLPGLDTMFSVEQAVLEDIPQLCELLGILFSQEADFSPDAAKQFEGLRLIISNPGAGRILVLRQNGRAVGMVNLLYSISTARGGRVAILEDMVVHPNHRGRGAGSTLLRATIDFAREQGCSRITLLTDRSNAEAMRFYERLGFVHSAMTPMRLMLTPTVAEQ